MKTSRISQCLPFYLLLLFMGLSTSAKAQIPITVIETEEVELTDAELIRAKIPPGPGEEGPVIVHRDTRLFRPSFYIGAAYEAFRVEEHDLLFRLFDDSGSNDLFTFEDQVNALDAAYGVNFGVEMIAAKAFLGLDFSFASKGKNNLATFNLAFGRTIPIKSVLLIPKVAIGFGSGKTYLGKMQNEDQYILIDKEEFLGDEVKVSIKTRLLQLVPSFDFYFPIGKKGRRIRAGVAYKLGVPFSERVEFDGYADFENEDSVKEHRPLSHEKHYIEKNGVLISEFGSDDDAKLKTIKFSGLRFQLGFGF